MLLKRILSVITSVTILLAIPNLVSAKNKEDSSAFGNIINEYEGTPSEFSLSYNSEDEMFNDMTLVCENRAYSMYFHKASLSVGIVDNKTGKHFLTNPYNAAKDQYYAGEIAELLDSQLVINYVDSKNVLNKFYSSSDCVKLGQYSVKFCENGIKVDYSIGEEREQLICPEVFIKKDFDKLVSQMDASDAEKIEYYYYLADFDSLTDSEVKELKSKYPFAKNEEIYVLIEINEHEQKTLDKALRLAGYDDKKYAEDLKKYNLTPENAAAPNIKLSLEYLLTDKGLTVTIPKDSITFNEESCYLYSVDFLPYFGADSEASGDSGYLFIPDGSGAIINIAGQSDIRRRIITSRVYGYDRALDLKNYKKEGKQYYLPVFGIVRNNSSAVFSVIGQGDTLSEITARLGAPSSNYYSVYNTFLYTTVEKVTMDAKVGSMNSAKNIYLHDDNISNDDFQISYYFLTGADANYSTMAELYREKLMSQGMKEKKFLKSLNIETIGNALYEDEFLGFTVNKEAKFTGYSDNISIIEYFKNEGIKDIDLSLTGWQKNGLDSGLTNKIKLSSTLGSKKEFQNLLEVCEKSDIRLYLGIDVDGVMYNRLFDGFIKKRDTAKKIDRSYANLSVYDVTTQRFSKEGFLVSPTRYEKIINSFLKSASKYTVSNVNLKSLGTNLNSDFDSSKKQNRWQTKNKLTKILKSNYKNCNLAFEGANAYILPFASQINKIPLDCSRYPGETASVPFLQLVLSGCVNSSSETVNLSGNSKTKLLQCISYGVSPSYALAYENVEILKATEHTEYYAVSFETLKKTIAQEYKYFKKAIKAVDGSRLVAHQTISADVSVSSFENGTKIIVNLGNSDYKVAGLIVSSQSYAII